MNIDDIKEGLTFDDVLLVRQAEPEAEEEESS